jgi:hypothetical protein
MDNIQEDEEFRPGEVASQEFEIERPVGVVVSTRLDRRLADRLIEAGERGGKSLSQILREAIDVYLPYVQTQSSPASSNYLVAAPSSSSTVVTSSRTSEIREGRQNAQPVITGTTPVAV